MKSSSPTPELGQIVAVRQRLYLVEQSVPPVNRGDSTLIQLSCVDDDAQGPQLDVLWERELDGQVIEAWDTIASRGFYGTRRSSQVESPRRNQLESQRSQRSKGLDIARHVKHNGSCMFGGYE